MLTEFGFNINSKSGKYILETDNNQIIHERLAICSCCRKEELTLISPLLKFQLTKKIFLDKATYQSIISIC